MNQWLLVANALTAFGITLCLLFCPCCKEKHGWRAAWLAYVLIVVCGVTVIRTVTGIYTGPVDLSEVVLKGILLLMIWRLRGNLNGLFHSYRYKSV